MAVRWKTCEERGPGALELSAETSIPAVHSSGLISQLVREKCARCVQHTLYFSQAVKWDIVCWPSKKRRPSSEQPWGQGNALRLRETTSTSSAKGSRSWSCDCAQATTDSMPTCSGKWSWHHHQPAGAVLKTRRSNILLRSLLLLKARQNVRLTAVQLHTKHYSSREELGKTATLILQTGLSV